MTLPYPTIMGLMMLYDKCLFQIYGFKPTPQRSSSYHNVQYGGEGQQCIPESFGPLARDIHGLVVGTQAIMSHNMYELTAMFPQYHSGRINSMN